MRRMHLKSCVPVSYTHLDVYKRQDKDYYTNSFHIPVYYSISAYNKIRLEAPYHAMTNGGHITYVEVDGDPVNNLEAFEDLIRAMKDMGVGYGSINHPVDRDPLCGYTGIIGDVCPRCGRHDGEGVDIEVLRKIKGYIRDVRSEEERLEACLLYTSVAMMPMESK